MRRLSLLLLVAIGLALLARPALGADNTAIFPQGTFFTVDQVGLLSRFDVATPGVRLGSVAIQGLQPAENILAIDFRPATGQLYGLGSTSRLYRIDAVTGAASPVGAPFTPALLGTEFGFDFDPSLDRIRVVSDNEQNLRLDPDTGQVTQADTAINPAGNLVASAYTNNVAGVPTTTLYGIDSNTDQLVIQSPQNNGALTPVGSLGFDTVGTVGFDIAPSGVAYASLTAPAATSSNLVTINLATGAATLVGTIATNNVVVRGLALVAGPDTVFGVTVGNKLVRFESSAPGSILERMPITGLQAGENILAIDFRPVTAELYGLGSTSRLYRIDRETGAATQVGSGQFDTLLNGTDFGFDFNPMTDRIRVVSDAEQNLRLNPDSGVITSTDPALTIAGNVVAAAHTNNFAGSVSTTLYDIDSGSDLLLIQSPPNFGTLAAVGSLGVDASGLTGFDISPGGTAYASITPPAGSATSLYRLNLATGAATLVGTIGGGEVIRDVAVRLATDVVYGVTQQAGPTHTLISFNAARPSTITSYVAITGLQAGEGLLGIDFRPITGQLFALGSTSRLYTIDLATGVATAVGAGPFSPLLSGTSFGFDFNPTVDLIRVVSDADQNLRLNPGSGVVQTTDTNLNPASGTVVAAAYTNSFAGAIATTLYDIDSVSDQLFIQSPPNNGTLVLVGSLGVDIGPSASFDIAALSGNAYFSDFLPAGSNPTFFKVNLATGAATAIGGIQTTETLVGFSILITRENKLFSNGFE